MTEALTKTSWMSNIKRSLRRLSKWTALVAGTFTVVLLIGLIPVNNDFTPDKTGVQIFVTSNAVHADLILPISNEIYDWRNEFPAEWFPGPIDKATHIAIGWGDKGFFVNTPTWADLKFSTAAHALLIPSPCCLHVVMTQAKFYEHVARSIHISKKQYEALVRHINESFQTDSNGGRIPIADAAYYNNDAFFQAKGNYHCFNTCNSWVGRGLRKAGVRVPMLTTMPKTVMLYLPETE